MINFRFSLVVASFSALALLGSCKKKEKKEDPLPVEEQTPKSVKQSDQSGTAAADAAIEDVNDIISNGIGGGSNKRMEEYRLPCGIVSLDSSTTDNGRKLYKIKYGKEAKCTNDFKFKTGTVVFQLTKGIAFSEEGAVFKITFVDYVVENSSTGDIVKVNGALYITNVKGGHIWQSVVNNTTIQHRIRGAFNVTYVSGAVREKKYFQLRTWNSSNGWAGLSFSATGDTAIGVNTKISEIGYTLDGNYYYETNILEDYIWKNTSSSFVGPYVLQLGHAQVNVAVPSITPAYFDVEAGYYDNLSSSTDVPVKVNDKTSNAYKIIVRIGTTALTQYQLY